MEAKFPKCWQIKLQVFCKVESVFINDLWNKTACSCMNFSSSHSKKQKTCIIYTSTFTGLLSKTHFMLSNLSETNSLSEHYLLRSRLCSESELLWWRICPKDNHLFCNRKWRISTNLHLPGYGTYPGFLEKGPGVIESQNREWGHLLFTSFQASTVSVTC